jgi:hypothetical protein
MFVIFVSTSVIHFALEELYAYNNSSQIHSP